MSTAEIAYLIMVIVAFVVFGVAVAGASWYETTGRNPAPEKQVSQRPQGAIAGTVVDAEARLAA